MSRYTATPGRSHKRIFSQCTKAVRWLPAALLATALVHGAQAHPALAGGKKIPLSKANVFFELNHTDGDLGIHLEIDGEAWKRLEIEDPKKSRILNIDINGRLQKQGLTELFSESAEPPFDKLPPKTFFSRFPEGKYKIRGTTLKGGVLEGTASLTHVMPAPPDKILVSGVAAPKDCDEGPVPSVGKPVVISWKPATRSHPELGKSAAVKVVKYEVVVAREEPTSLSFSVDLPPKATSFQVPKDFIALDSGDGFKFEILVREASGNQTAFESCFKVKK
jgi:hypothetical protein